MMITPTSAARQPEICPTEWTGDPQQCPTWVGFPTRTSLPAGLQWSGTREVPAIGAGVHIYLNSFGPAVVRAYFHADGFLGVLCEFQQVPTWFSWQCPGVTMGHIFGRELEPARAMPLNSEYSSETRPVGEEESASALSPADDWIPDTPLRKQTTIPPWQSNEAKGGGGTGSSPAFCSFFPPPAFKHYRNA